MTRARFSVLAALTALLGSALAATCPAEDALDLVRRSQSADRTVSYRGLKYADIWIAGRVIRAHFKIVHSKPDRTRTEYFAPSELAGIITIDRGTESWRFLPNQRKWQHYKWELAPGRLDLALANYRVVPAGQATVAGRPAAILQLVPKKRGNPSLTIWVDARHYVVLKTESRNASGAPTTISAFRQITFEPNDIPASAFEARPDVKVPGNPVRYPKVPVVKPRYVPKGYSFVNVSIVQVGKQDAWHLMYTNGINTISIFERERGGKDTGNWKPGIANLTRLDQGNTTFTIISDIDKRELRKIADSLR